MKRYLFLTALLFSCKSQQKIPVSGEHQNQITSPIKLQDAVKQGVKEVFLLPKNCYDTSKLISIFLVDTAKENKGDTSFIFWTYGYRVNVNTTQPSLLNSAMYNNGVLPKSEYYLDANKKQLSNNYIMWRTKE
jgi:hypothetical protein